MVGVVGVVVAVVVVVVVVVVAREVPRRSMLHSSASAFSCIQHRFLF